MPLLLLALLAPAIYFFIKNDPPKPKVSFVNARPEKEIRYGDTLDFINQSERIDSASVAWEIEDAEGKVKPLDSRSYDLRYIADDVEKGPEKTLRLTAKDLDDGEQFTFQYSFTVNCKTSPKIVSIEAPKEAAVGDEITFNAVMADDAEVDFEWDLAEGFDKIKKQEATQKFNKKGLYEVKLTAIRKDLPGHCEHTLTHRISIGKEDAYLLAKPLAKDAINPLVQFSVGTYILLGLLGLAMIFYWVRWANRKPPATAEAQHELDLAAAKKKYQSVDRGPYFIPFRSQNGGIRVDRELYRLSDVMRLRQEGLRKEMDIPVSVRETIAGGGFPALLTKSDTVPTEYLFLIDEQSHASHQRRLFEFVVDFLRQREVIGEVFYFNSGLHSFWNGQFPDGLRASQLQRMFPFHRLVLLGDGHQLVDSRPRKDGKPTLKKEALNLFRQWKHRLLLTPLPVVSWDYQEGALHEIFAVFPSDTDGLGEAIKHIERGTGDEERAAYAYWCEGLAEGRNEADVDRRWRSAADHRDYLKDHPRLYQWLCALAVYPDLDWNITLAIGRALSPLGVEVSYDNLLLLCRIPWLNDGHLKNRLRKQLLADLDPEAERLARQAVKEELEAVQSLVANSQVNQEHQINLALQNFALAPQNADNQATVREMLALNLLTDQQKREFEEGLPQRGEQQGFRPDIAQQKIMSQKGLPLEEPPSLEDFLEKNKAAEAPPEKPFFTLDFYKAAAVSLLYLVLFLFAWDYNGTEQLAEWAGQDMAATTDCQPEHLAFYFLKKECMVDSAAELNNRAVDIWNALSLNASPTNPIDFSEKNKADSLTLADSLFHEAKALRNDYELAAKNIQLLKYDLGVHTYNYYVENPGDVEMLRSAASYFGEVEKDSLEMDAMHGRGLSELYLADALGTLPDVAEAIYGNMMRKDSSYFDSLEMYPHLQSLLFRDRSVLVNIKVVDAKTKQPIAKAKLRSQEFGDGTTGRDGIAEFKMTTGQRGRFEVSRRGYQTNTLDVTGSSNRAEFLIELKPDAPVPQQNINLPKGDIEFCYAVGGKLFKGYFSVDYLLFKNGREVPVDNVLAYDEMPNPVIDIKAVAKNLTWAKAEHAKKYELDFFVTNDFGRGDGEGLEVQVRKKALAVGGKAEIVFSISNTADLKNANLLLAGLVKDKNCPVDYRSLGEKEFASGCVAGMVFTAKPLVYFGSRTPVVGRELLAKLLKRAAKPMAKELSAISCRVTEGNILDGGKYDPDGDLRKAFDALDVKRDDDGDGVLNYRDECPDVKGARLNKGCPAENKIEFTIQDAETYRPLSGVQVTVYDSYQQGYPPKQLRSDEKGSVAFEGKKPGMVELSYPGYEGRQIENIVSLIQHGEDEPVVYLTKKDSGGDLDPILQQLEANMVFVKGGKFKMGCDPERDGECEERELPLHDVSLSDFYIGKYEVTNEEYAVFLNDYGSAQVKDGAYKGELMVGEYKWGIEFRNFKGEVVYRPQKGYEKYPVVKVTWYGATEYAKWLSQKTGKGYRLPTEAEWEYAARGGNRSKGYQYAGSNDLKEVGWYEKNSGSQTHPVGQKKANELRVYDMSGNVWEWCSDGYDENYYKQFEKVGARNPKGAESEGIRVVRGGSWDSSYRVCRSAYRDWFNQDIRYYYVGFRLAR